MYVLLSSCPVKKELKIIEINCVHVFKMQKVHLKRINMVGVNCTGELWTCYSKIFCVNCFIRSHDEVRLLHYSWLVIKYNEHLQVVIQLLTKGL